LGYISLIIYISIRVVVYICIVKVEKEIIFVLLGVLILLSIGTYKFFKESEPQPSYFDKKESFDIKETYDYYYLVVGSFKNYDLASNFSDSLKSVGFESELILSDDGYKRVSVFKSLDRETAVETKLLYRENIKKIWIYHK